METQNPLCDTKKYVMINHDNLLILECWINLQLKVVTISEIDPNILFIVW